MAANQEIPRDYKLPLQEKGLYIYHRNVCSVFPKLDELKILIGNSYVGIYGVTETHLSSTILDSLLSITGYSLFRRDRCKGRGGGVAAYVSNYLDITRRSDLESDQIESLWLEVKQNGAKSFLLAFVCRIPNATLEWYLLFLDSIHSTVTILHLVVT